MITHTINRVTIHEGDCLQSLRAMPDDCIDSIVTDPPYGLSFMGKRWDYDVPSVELWQECLRVLKPGGHLLAFAGTRTQHRMAVRIEDAGFEIRDMIAWCYGCLSEDTELLINGRWEHYSKAIDGGLALCYDAEHDEYRWEAIQDFVEYDYSDTAYRIVSDRTDQIVSRNHRCLVKRSRGFVFQLAETLECEETVPILESLPELFNNLSLPDQRTSSQKSLLQPRVRTEKSWQTKADGASEGAGNCVCCVRQGSMEVECLAEKSENSMLQSILSRKICDGTNPSCEQIRPNGNEISGHRNERRKESCMERRRDVLPQAGELQTDQVCSVSGGIHVDGPEGRLCDGAQVGCCDSDRAMSFENGSCSSYRPRSNEQCNSEPDVVCEQSRPQIIRSKGYTVADLAKVIPTHYVGKVWCIRVPTGAFVARRNGKVFVTGNSGFPKSLDVSKAIDKAAGAEREQRWKPVTAGSSVGTLEPRPWLDEARKNGGCFVDGETPATEAAKQWQGWGSALKPALEPITVARKPLVGTIAANVLQHGTGAINVDACRVGTETLPEATAGQAKIGTFERGVMVTPERTGRWPANIIHDGSEEVVSLFPEAGGGFGKRGAARQMDGWGMGGDLETIGFGDSGSAARFFYCAKAGPDERRNSKHPTVKPLALMRYLCRLVCPPDGIVLDPFCGSGTTLEAARLEGFGAIGCELNPEYIADCKERLKQGVLF